MALCRCEAPDKANDYVGSFLMEVACGCSDFTCQPLDREWFDSVCTNDTTCSAEQAIEIVYDREYKNIASPSSPYRNTQVICKKGGTRRDIIEPKDSLIMVEDAISGSPKFHLPGPLQHSCSSASESACSRSCSTSELSIEIESWRQGTFRNECRNPPETISRTYARTKVFGRRR